MANPQLVAQKTDVTAVITTAEQGITPEFKPGPMAAPMARREVGVAEGTFKDGQAYAKNVMDPKLGVNEAERLKTDMSALGKQLETIGSQAGGNERYGTYINGLMTRLGEARELAGQDVEGARKIFSEVQHGIEQYSDVVGAVRSLRASGAPQEAVTATEKALDLISSGQQDRADLILATAKMITENAYYFKNKAGRAGLDALTRKMGDYADESRTIDVAGAAQDVERQGMRLGYPPAQQAADIKALEEGSKILGSATADMLIGKIEELSAAGNARGAQDLAMKSITYLEIRRAANESMAAVENAAAELRGGVMRPGEDAVSRSATLEVMRSEAKESIANVDRIGAALNRYAASGSAEAVKGFDAAMGRYAAMEDLTEQRKRFGGIPEIVGLVKFDESLPGRNMGQLFTACEDAAKKGEMNAYGKALEALNQRLAIISVKYEMVKGLEQMSHDLGAGGAIREAYGPAPAPDLVERLDRRQRGVEVFIGMVRSGTVDDATLQLYYADICKTLGEEHRAASATSMVGSQIEQNKKYMKIVGTESITGRLAAQVLDESESHLKDAEGDLARGETDAAARNYAEAMKDRRIALDMFRAKPPGEGPLAKDKPFALWEEMQNDVFKGVLAGTPSTQLDNLVKGSNLIEMSIFDVPTRRTSNFFSNFEPRQKAVRELVQQAMAAKNAEARNDLLGAAENQLGRMQKELGRNEMAANIGLGVVGTVATVVPGMQGVGVAIFMGMTLNSAMKELDDTGKISPATWAMLITTPLMGPLGSAARGLREAAVAYKAAGAARAATALNVAGRTLQAADITTQAGFAGMAAVGTYQAFAQGRPGEAWYNIGMMGLPMGLVFARTRWGRALEAINTKRTSRYAQEMQQLERAPKTEAVKAPEAAAPVAERAAPKPVIAEAKPAAPEVAAPKAAARAKVEEAPKPAEAAKKPAKAAAPEEKAGVAAVEEKSAAVKMRERKEKAASVREMKGSKEEATTVRYSDKQADEFTNTYHNSEKFMIGNGHIGELVRSIQRRFLNRAAEGQEMDMVVIATDKSALNDYNAALGESNGDRGLGASFEIIRRVAKSAGVDDRWLMRVAKATPDRPGVKSSDEGMVILCVKKGEGDALRAKLKTEIARHTDDVLRERIAPEHPETIAHLYGAVSDMQKVVKATFDIGQTIEIRNANGEIKVSYGGNPEATENFLCRAVRKAEEVPGGSGRFAQEMRERLGIPEADEMILAKNIVEVKPTERLNGAIGELVFGITSPEIHGKVTGEVLPAADKGLKGIGTNELGISELNTVSGHGGANGTMNAAEAAVSEYAETFGFSIRRAPDAGTLKYVIDGGTKAQFEDMCQFVTGKLHEKGMDHFSIHPKGEIIEATGMTMGAALAKVKNGKYNLDWTDAQYKDANSLVSGASVFNDLTMTELLGTDYGRMSKIVDLIRDNRMIRNVEDLMVALERPSLLKRPPDLTGPEIATMKKTFVEFVQERGGTHMVRNPEGKLVEEPGTYRQNLDNLVKGSKATAESAAEAATAAKAWGGLDVVGGRVVAKPKEVVPGERAMAEETAPGTGYERTETTLAEFPGSETLPPKLRDNVLFSDPIKTRMSDTEGMIFYLNELGTSSPRKLGQYERLLDGMENALDETDRAWMHGRFRAIVERAAQERGLPPSARPVQEFLNNATDSEIMLLVRGRGMMIEDIPAPVFEVANARMVVDDPGAFRAHLERVRNLDENYRELAMEITASRTFDGMRAKLGPVKLVNGETPRVAKLAGMEYPPELAEGAAFLRRFGMDPKVHERFAWKGDDLVNRARLYYRIEAFETEFTAQLNAVFPGKEATIKALMKDAMEGVTVQDVNDSNLPFTPHGWQHALDMRDLGRKVFEGAPAVAENLTKTYGSRERALAAVDLVSILHDVGYGNLAPTANKGLHPIESGRIFKEEFLPRVAEIFGVDMKGRSAEEFMDTEPIIKEIHDAILLHGADKPGATSPAYTPASDTYKPLLLVARTADNLDMTVGRMRAAQTDPMMLEALLKMRDSGNEVRASYETQLRDLHPQSKGETAAAYAGRIKGMMSSDAVKQLIKDEVETERVKIVNEYCVTDKMKGRLDGIATKPKLANGRTFDDALILSDLLGKLNESTWDHFIGCRKVVDVEISEGKLRNGETGLVIDVVLDGKADAGATNQGYDGALYQVMRAADAVGGSISYGKPPRLEVNPQMTRKEVTDLTGVAIRYHETKPSEDWGDMYSVVSGSRDFDDLPPLERRGK